MTQYRGLTILGDIWLGPDALVYENRCASTLGHELVHATQDPNWQIRCSNSFNLGLGPNYAELEAYGWELDHASQTGLDSTDVLITNAFWLYYNNQGPYPGD
jgi:hypothetical protein